MTLQAKLQIILAIWSVELLVFIGYDLITHWRDYLIPWGGNFSTGILLGLFVYAGILIYGNHEEDDELVELGIIHRRRNVINLILLILLFFFCFSLAEIFESENLLYLIVPFFAIASEAKSIPDNVKYSNMASLNEVFNTEERQNSNPSFPIIRTWIGVSVFAVMGISANFPKLFVSLPSLPLNFDFMIAFTYFNTPAISAVLTIWPITVYAYYKVSWHSDTMDEKLNRARLSSEEENILIQNHNIYSAGWIFAVIVFVWMIANYIDNMVLIRQTKSSTAILVTKLSSVVFSVFYLLNFILFKLDE